MAVAAHVPNYVRLNFFARARGPPGSEFVRVLSVRHGMRSFTYYISPPLGEPYQPAPSAMDTLTVVLDNWNELTDDLTVCT
jgi:hypothetical protein